MRSSYPKRGDAQTIALRVIGWIVAETGRAERFLAMTGLDGDQLRAGLSGKAIPLAAMDFLLGHSPSRSQTSSRATGSRLSLWRKASSNAVPKVKCIR
ncbi:MAG TPA: DUF3572 family protein [Sphingobium sp.]|nr:DUF3572 family protein [Sphingobium sp.]